MSNRRTIATYRTRLSRRLLRFIATIHGKSLSNLENALEKDLTEARATYRALGEALDRAGDALLAASSRKDTVAVGIAGERERIIF